MVTDWNKCKAKGDCVGACPYEARFLDPRYGKKSDKCDFCRNRIDHGLEPACVEACSEKARLFGDLKNPQGEFGEYLKRGDLVVRKPDLGLKGRVLYVPSRKGRRGGLLRAIVTFRPLPRRGLFQDESCSSSGQRLPRSLLWEEPRFRPQRKCSTPVAYKRRLPPRSILT